MLLVNASMAACSPPIFVDGRLLSAYFQRKRALVYDQRSMHIRRRGLIFTVAVGTIKGIKESMRCPFTQ